MKKILVLVKIFMFYTGKPYFLCKWKLTKYMPYVSIYKAGMKTHEKIHVKKYNVYIDLYNNNID